MKAHFGRIDELEQRNQVHGMVLPFGKQQFPAAKGFHGTCGDLYAVFFKRSITVPESRQRLNIFCVRGEEYGPFRLGNVHDVSVRMEGALGLVQIVQSMECRNNDIIKTAVVPSLEDQQFL